MPCAGPGGGCTTCHRLLAPSSAPGAAKSTDTHSFLWHSQSPLGWAGLGSVAALTPPPWTPQNVPLTHCRGDCPPTSSRAAPDPSQNKSQEPKLEEKGNLILGKQRQSWTAACPDPPSGAPHRPPGKEDHQELVNSPTSTPSLKECNYCPWHPQKPTWGPLGHREPLGGDKPRGEPGAEL